MARATRCGGRVRVGLVFVAAALMIVGSAARPGPTVHAATTVFTVNTSDDAVDANPGDGACVTAAGQCSLRAAIMEANIPRFSSSPLSYTIMLQPGATYFLTIIGANEDFAATGDLDIWGNVTLQGSTSSPPYIEPNPTFPQSWDDRLFDIMGGANATFSGVFLCGCGWEPKTASGSPDVGGSIRNHGTLTLKDTRVCCGSASAGGDIYNASGPLALDNSRVNGGSATGTGGGIDNEQGSVTLKNGSELDTNTAGTTGAGLYNGPFGTATVTGSTFSGNVAANGGDIDNLGSLNVQGSSFDGGSTTGFDGNGGAIYNTGTMTLTMSSMSNAHTGTGGGIFNDPRGTATVTGSTFSGNFADNTGGGGVFNAGSMTVTNSTVSFNQARFGEGGGILNAGGTLKLTNVTMANNSAQSQGSGLIRTNGTVDVANSIIALNALPRESGPDCAGAITSQGYNLIGNTSGCTITGTTTGNILNQEPRLGSLGSNGGTTQTQPLLGASGFGKTFIPPSLGIDAGNPAAPGSGGTACPATDQRGSGFPRPIDGNGDGVAVCDMGAYEAPVRSSLGTFAVTPQQATGQVGKHLSYSFAWTVPAGGWRGLDSLDLRLLDDQGTALWVRFHELAGNASTLGLVNAEDYTGGTSFTFGSSNRLETNAATVYLATSTLDGPAGSPTVALHLDLGLKPQAAGRTFQVLVLAVDDTGKYEGFVEAGTLTVQAGAH